MLALLLGLLFFTALAVLAPRLGVDSRGLRADEPVVPTWPAYPAPPSH